LAPYVKCYWILEQQEQAVAIEEQVVPDGSPELIFHFGDRYYATIDGTRSLQPQNIIVGQITRSIQLQATGNSGILAVRFHPWGLFPFIQMPVSQFTDSFVGFEDIFQKAKYGNISDAITNVRHDDKIKLVENFLSGLLKLQRPKIQRQFERVAPVLQGLRTGKTVDDMAYSANLCNRQFNRLTNHIAGVSPKLLVRIIRFNRFMELYQAEKDQPVTNLLYTCGYYDQSHFIREFKEITGETPARFFSKANEFSDLILGH
jgi:AraC-like DNA-binding protein